MSNSWRRSCYCTWSACFKDVPLYTVVVGVPTRILKSRFSKEQQVVHCKILKGKRRRDESIMFN